MGKKISPASSTCWDRRGNVLAATSRRFHCGLIGSLHESGRWPRSIRTPSRVSRRYQSLGHFVVGKLPCVVGRVGNLENRRPLVDFIEHGNIDAVDLQPGEFVETAPSRTRRHAAAVHEAAGLLTLQVVPTEAWINNRHPQRTATIALLLVGGPISLSVACLTPALSVE